MPRRHSAKWSRRVTRTSDAMTLDRDVFKRGNAADVARSVSRSAAKSRRRKSFPLRSAISMISFYIDRAGRNLSTRRRSILQRARKLLSERNRHR